MDVEPEVMRGGWGKVADRNGRCKNIDSVFVGLRRSELELSQLCNDDIQSFQAICGRISTIEIYLEVVSVGVEGYVWKFFEYLKDWEDVYVK